MEEWLMNIDAKLQEFDENLEDMANRDYDKIKLKIEEEIKLAIEQEVGEYEAKKQANYDKNVQKIEKDFNKKIYNYEINLKKEIIDEEKRLKNNIKNEALKILKEFTLKPEYQQFLIKCIRERNGKS